MRLYVALYAYNMWRPLAPGNVDEDFLSVAGASETDASDSGSEDDVPVEKRRQ